jgi:hypothetical protein
MKLASCPSVRMKQLGSHGTDFHEIRIFRYIFPKSVEKFNFLQNMTRIPVIIHEDLHTHIISRRILLRMRNASHRTVLRDTRRFNLTHTDKENTGFFTATVFTKITTVQQHCAQISRPNSTKLGDACWKKGIEKNLGPLVKHWFHCAHIQ